MIKAAVLVLLSATFINSNVCATGGALKHSCSDILDKFNKCWTFENCLNYQVTEQYTDYGCGVCDEYYELQQDANAAGYCLYNPNSVKYCIFPAKTVTGQAICYECESNFILANDLSSCTPKPNKCSRIPNCESYIYDSNGGIICLTCKDNFTTSSDGKHCNPGCNVANCEKCVDYNGAHQCFLCQENFIGIWNPAALSFDACLSCDQFQCELLTVEAKQCCLNQLSQCHN